MEKGEREKISWSEGAGKERGGVGFGIAFLRTYTGTHKARLRQPTSVVVGPWLKQVISHHVLGCALGLFGGEEEPSSLAAVGGAGAIADMCTFGQASAGASHRQQFN